jgi:hypothetical protein
MRSIFTLFLTVLLVLVIGCNGPSQESETTEVEATIKTPNFDSEKAYQYVAKQVGFGPRVPSSKGHEACAQWLISQLNASCDTVIIQPFEAKTYDGKTHACKNIIGSINPNNTNRIILCAHWDTRHMADKDTKNQNQPILGANDGGSGVGVLLALAEAIHSQKPTLGIDFILFDAEDYGKNDDEASWCLGSQYWSSHMHRDGYSAKFGVLLDMIGGKEATFFKESWSQLYARNLVSQVWEIASILGYSKNFIYQDGGGITDDHAYMNTVAKIPTIDIIHTTMDQGGFPSYHHTHADNMDAVDKQSLKAVGDVMMQLIYKEDQRSK